MMEKTITINGRDIVAKTLTAPQIADLMAGLDGTRKATLAEMLMDSDVPIDAVLASTGLSADWFEGPVTPDEIFQVWEAVIATNGFLSRMLSRLTTIADVLEPPRQSGSGATSAE
jgi:hypothetical protein